MVVSQDELLKPYLRLRFPDGSEIKITTNIGEMIGGVSKGARQSWEYLHPGPIRTIPK